MEPRFATPPGRPAHLARLALALGVAAAMAVLLGLPGLPGLPAVEAQAGPQITVEAVHPLSGGEFHFIVALADGNGDPLTGTTVTATPTSPSGTTGGAVALPSSGDGTYQGPVPLPEDGTWTVRIASADPAGAIDYGFEVTGDTGTPVGPVGTTVPATTTLPAPTTTTTATTAPATTATTAEPEAEETAAPSSDEDDDSGFPVVLLIVGAALVVALAGVPLALRTIRSSTADGPPDPRDPSAPGETPESD